MRSPAGKLPPLGLAALLFLFSLQALADFYSSVTVVEFYNAINGHYFLTADPGEAAAIRTGAAGPGWLETGLHFQGDVDPAGSYPGISPARPETDSVCRFYGTPGVGPNSHFFTRDPAECVFVRRPGSGWDFEKIAFFSPAPPCVATSPVYRLYNNRWMFNDSNHRYTAVETVRDAMVAKGWTYEGVAFCTASFNDPVSRSFVLEARDRILADTTCEDESVNLGSCVATNNLPPPRNLVIGVSQITGGFGAVTGTHADLTRTLVAGTLEEMAGHEFVQLQTDHDGTSTRHTFGIHVNSLDRATDLAFSSINPIFKFPTHPEQTSFGEPFYPWRMRDADTDVELAILFSLFVKTIEAQPGSHAYGHPTLMFRDTRSGQYLYFTIGAYGTIALDGDYLAPDVITLRTIVGTTFRPVTRYGRSLGSNALPTPAGFVSPSPGGSGGDFEFHMNRDEFLRVLADARSVNPSLSSLPEDYLLDNFHFNNEVVGTGRIGVTLRNYRLQVRRRSPLSN